jgi:Ohr subfamily peroxiredoxin
METLYTAIATTTAGRAGHAKTDDGVLDLQLSVPKGLGGAGGPGTNPEQLFAAGFSACFGGAMALAAKKLNLQPKQIAITAKVSIGKEAGGFGLAVELIGHLPDVPQKDADRLMEATHQICPYSKATRNNVQVVLKAEGKK